jgi:hypothetical protein
MGTAPRRAATAFGASVVVLSFAAALAAKPFVGPDGWEHVVGMLPASQVSRAQETWKKNDGEQLAYLSDAGLSYDDIIALVKKNIAENAIKTAVDKDRTCQGRRAHEIEMTFSPSIVHQIIIDDAPGVTKLTYTRPQGTSPSADASSAIAAYCGP